MAASIMIFSGCYRIRTPLLWSAAANLESVPESQPHGTLIIKRNSSSLYLLVDGKHAFNEIDQTEASFRLAPGQYPLKLRFHNSNQYSKIMERSLTIVEGKERVIALVKDMNKFGIKQIK